MNKDFIMISELILSNPDQADTIITAYYLVIVHDEFIKFYGMRKDG